jgi:hypothetical protein
MATLGMRTKDQSGFVEDLEAPDCTLLADALRFVVHELDKGAPGAVNRVFGGEHVPVTKVEWLRRMANAFETLGERLSHPVTRVNVDAWEFPPGKE